jgi:hypothetical protein
MRRTALALALAVAVVGCGDSPEPQRVVSQPAPTPACDPPRVHYTPYAGGDRRLDGIPWIEGTDSGLVGLLWYWPKEWRHREARIFTGGVAPQGYSAKLMWVFLDPEAKDRGGAELLVEGRRLNGPGRIRERFAAIGYAGQQGAPSYASIVDLPKPGCWRLTLTTGDLRATVDMRAVRL